MLAFVAILGIKSLTLATQQMMILSLVWAQFAPNHSLVTIYFSKYSSRVWCPYDYCAASDCAGAHL